MKRLEHLSSEYATKHFPLEKEGNIGKYDVASHSFAAGFNQAMRILMDVGNILSRDWRVEKDPKEYIQMEDSVLGRERVKELLPLFNAFADGKVIEGRAVGLTDWHVTDVMSVCFFENAKMEYRIKEVPEYAIKSEPSHRPFVSQDECWNEMLRHQPFGWVVCHESGSRVNLHIVDDDGVGFSVDGVYANIKKFSFMFENYSFDDGTPFGVRLD